MNDMSPPLSRRGFDFDAWDTHVSAIIRSEVKRRGISVRALFTAGALKSRNGFAKRLNSSTLRPKEVSDLAGYLGLELPHLMTAFLASEPDESYNHSVFENFSLLHQALIMEYERSGMDHLPEMERLRPSVLRVLAGRILEHFRDHHLRCEQVRDALVWN